MNNGVRGLRARALTKERSRNSGTSSRGVGQGGPLDIDAGSASMTTHGLAAPSRRELRLHWLRMRVRRPAVDRFPGTDRAHGKSLRSGGGMAAGSEPQFSSSRRDRGPTGADGRGHPARLGDPAAGAPSVALWPLTEQHRWPVRRRPAGRVPGRDHRHERVALPRSLPDGAAAGGKGHLHAR